MNTDKLASTNFANRRARSRKAAYALGVVVGIISIYAAFRFAVPPDPPYQGKRLSEWLVDLDGRHSRTAQQKAKEAVKAIGAEGVPMLISMLRRHDSALRRKLAKEFEAPSFAQAEVYQTRALAAFEVLGPSAKQAIPELEKQLQQGDLRYDVAAVMLCIDREAGIKALSGALSRGNAEVRRAAAWRLAGLVTNVDPLLPVLLNALKDSEPEVRMGAARALGHSHKRLDVVVPALSRQLVDTNQYCRMYAFDALGELGNQAGSAAPIIKQFLSVTNAYERSWAVVALVRVEPAAAAQAGHSTSDLVKGLGDADENKRATSMFALWMLREQLQDQAPQVIPALITRIGDSNQKLRGLAVTTLGEFGKDAESALPALARCFEDPDTIFREKVTNVIEQIDPGYFVRTNR